MLFTEPTFVFFFLPLLLGLYLMSPAGWRNTLLAFTSLLFYSWEYLPHVMLLLGSITLNYVFGLALGGTTSSGKRRMILTIGIGANLGLLGFFKYAGFLAANLNGLFEAIGVSRLPEPQIILPLGISFFTFQAVSYIVDVYRRDTPPQKSLINLALYISLFPQLIAGPIVRYGQLAAQIVERCVSVRDFAIGARRFTIGLGKKVLIANTVAQASDQVFGLPGSELTPALAWLGILCYTLQIYFDFSGYSDMAVGLGRMFGFKIPENFNYPYAARSIKDFWRRWHISLSSWFRDYLYIPLGGNRIRPTRMGLNLLAVFLLCGLWHGASWNLLVWGLFHGLLLVIERVAPPKMVERIPRYVRHSYTMILIMIGWVIFRSEDLDQATHFLSVMIGANDGLGGLIKFADIFPNDVLLACGIGLICALPSYRLGRDTTAWVARRTKDRRFRFAVFLAAQIAGNLSLLLVLLLSAIWISALTYTPFIYFRF